MAEKPVYQACVEARKIGTRDGEFIRGAARQAGIVDRNQAEIDRLREIVRRYGDRQRMSFAPPELQQTIDDALGAAPPEPTRPAGDLRHEYDPIAGKMRYFGSSAPNGWVGDAKPTANAEADICTSCEARINEEGSP